MPYNVANVTVQKADW